MLAGIGCGAAVQTWNGWAETTSASTYWDLAARSTEPRDGFAHNRAADIPYWRLVLHQASDAGSLGRRTARLNGSG
jgi:hypothetical protein